MDTPDYQHEALQLLARTLYTGEFTPIEAIHHLRQYTDNTLTFEQARDLIYPPNGPHGWAGENMRRNHPELYTRAQPKAAGWRRLLRRRP